MIEATRRAFLIGGGIASLLGRKPRRPRKGVYRNLYSNTY